MGAVTREGAQLAGRAVQHDDRPGGETGGAADLGEEVCVRAFQLPEDQRWFRGDLPEGACLRQLAAGLERGPVFVSVGTLVG